MILALSIVLTNVVWAYVAIHAIDALAAKHRARDVSALSAELQVMSQLVSSATSDVDKCKERIARMEMKRS